MTRVAVIVVNYNTGEDTVACVASASADLAGVPHETIVVDNASTDPPFRLKAETTAGGDITAKAETTTTGEITAKAETTAGAGTPPGAVPRIRLIANETNRGFGTAINQAVRTTDAELLWMLNPDCRVTPGTFETLARTLGAHSDCAIAAPQLLNADGSTQASARGEPDAWTGLFGRHAILTKFFPSAGAARRNLPAADFVASGVESAPVDWVMGAAMLVKREAFEQVGGFDERYFLYWEDADLCRRLREAGWTTRYVPGARVEHPGGASAKTSSRLATRAFHDSAYRYYATHVVRSAWHPLRWFARVALALRARFRMWRT